MFYHPRTKYPELNDKNALSYTEFEIGGPTMQKHFYSVGHNAALLHSLHSE